MQCKQTTPPSSTSCPPLIFPAAITVSQGSRRPHWSCLPPPPPPPPACMAAFLCLRSLVSHWHEWARRSCYGGRAERVRAPVQTAGSWISSAAISIWTPVMWQYDRDYAIWGREAGVDRGRGRSEPVRWGTDAGARYVYWRIMGCWCNEKGVKSTRGLKLRSRQNTEIGWQMK